jgi:hypothetical protein
VFSIDQVSICWSQRFLTGDAHARRRGVDVRDVDELLLSVLSVFVVSVNKQLKYTFVISDSRVLLFFPRREARSFPASYREHWSGASRPTLFFFFFHVFAHYAD